MDTRHPTPFRTALSISVLTSLAFFAMGCWILVTGNLHEDAYILFTYVDNVTSGNGIVYYEGGEHAEGATDFLWLFLSQSSNCSILICAPSIRERDISQDTCQYICRFCPA